MIKIALPESHEEPNSFYLRQMLSERFNFLVMEKIHIFLPDLLEIILPLNAHSRHLNPVSVLPVGSGSGNFTEINFRIKVRCKRIAVVTPVTVEDIDSVNRIEEMLLRICRKDRCHARIEAGAKQCREARILKSLLIRPLPGIIKICREAFFLTPLFIDCTPCRIIRVLRLIICRIDIVDARRKTRIHDREILIRQGNIEHRIRLIGFDQFSQLFHVRCIDLCCRNDRLCLSFKLSLYLITLRFRPACDHQFRKHFIILTRLLDCHLRDTTTANHHQSLHLAPPFQTKLTLGTVLPVSL